MKTYISDIIPKIQKYSEKLDNLTLLTNQHWVVFDELTNSKCVYIFRTSKELLISQNGKVEKARWEYLGNNSLLIDRKDESYLFKHGFFDENILALKVDGSNEYAFLINENRFETELNSIDKVLVFLTNKYIEPQLIKKIGALTSKPGEVTKSIKPNYNTTRLETKQGKLEIRTKLHSGYTLGDKVFLNGEPAPDGKYVYGWPAWASSIRVKNGEVEPLW